MKPNNLKEEDLMKLLDEYMSKGGTFMKPTVNENGSYNFLIGRDDSKAEAADQSIEILEEIIEKKENKLFTANATIECVNCSDIPNLDDIDEM